MEFFFYYLDFMASDLQYHLVASFGSMWFNRIIFKCKKKKRGKKRKETAFKVMYCSRYICMLYIEFLELQCKVFIDC